MEATHNKSRPNDTGDRRGHIPPISSPTPYNQNRDENTTLDDPNAKDAEGDEDQSEEHEDRGSDPEPVQR